ncbi:hypothetical protein B5X24_HaOG216019 [Helicoverpa armigera]|nr:hypothetical protein B5X24_HaOG216019 [Helicoverpa armigera]
MFTDTHQIDLPPFGRYATGIFFLDKLHHQDIEKKFGELAESLGLTVLCWRTVPTNNSTIGQVARNSEPFMRQVFVTGDSDDELLARQVRTRRGKHRNETGSLRAHWPAGRDHFVPNIFVLRKRASHELVVPGARFYICSLALKTVVYKGLLTSQQLWEYFKDLTNPAFTTYLALVHTRFSTNTFPSWERAHPLRVLAHNGEINTLRGNVNLMKAREGVMKSELFGEDLKKLYPVVEPNLSDSGSADCVLEFLLHAGQRSLPEAVMTMVPEAWQNDVTMPKEKRDYYQWASSCMEPWDGPALVSFTDGRYIGAILDRNGLRPSRFYVTSENILVMASEVGVYDVDPDKVILKSRLKPGRMLLVDTEEKKLVQDAELKMEIARSRPHSEWLQDKITMEDIHKSVTAENGSSAVVSNGNGTDGHENGGVITGLADKRLGLFGYTIESIHMLLLPMIQNKKEALGSMGNDAPLACLSQFQPMPYEYFKQLFAQVTNPPIDPFREKIVMSLLCPIGPAPNILQPSAEFVHRLFLPQPILSLPDLYALKHTTHRGWKTKVIDCTFDYLEGPSGMEPALGRIAGEAHAAAASGYQLIVLSDRQAGRCRVPVSTLLALGAVHHHLIETRQRMKVGIILETAEAREVHHMCVLLGYGADAICPYLAFELAFSLRNDHILDPNLTDEDIYKAYQGAIETGLAKVMAKMGISTLQSYKSAQIFEAVGLCEEVIDKCFRGTQSRIGGVNFEILSKEIFDRHALTYGEVKDALVLRNPGNYHWRAGGEKHINDPMSIANLQEAAINKSSSAYDKYRESALESIRACTLRGQLELVKLDEPIPLSEVEPAVEIVKRFATGAMSFGSISLEAHTSLAIAMNRIGGKSNTGEGGENADRYLNQDPEFNKRSAIKQVASGRFGVTASYLAHADDLQIKMAQGAKPGEGGELPGYKVTEDIAKTRCSVPGVGLISPPPHHDIYSIEDLAELIYDLKAANPRARISVKLVSEVGVGVVASGVAKGKAEHIVISGHDGGTGASSWTGIKSAGLPWELGVAETHQVLVLNDLRSRVVVQADGQIRTGFDVMVAALLGADEFGFSTAPLIALGKFDLDYVFTSDLVRQHMAEVGVRRFQDLIGRTDLLKVRENNDNPKARMLNLSLILKNALHMRPGVNIIGGSKSQDFQLEKRLDNQLISQCSALWDGSAQHVDINMRITNEDRAFTSTLSYHIAMKYGDDGLPDGKTVNISLTGSAGQSFWGIAYVYDIDGSFSGKCNHEMVELLPLELQDDLDYVQQLLQEFHEYTGSLIAEEFLKTWPEPAKKFIKVFPYEYQRALKSMAVKQPTQRKVETNGKAENGVLDIEETVKDVELETKNLEKILDKTSGHVRRGVRVQAARCMECGVPFCQSGHGCPLGNIVPKWNDLVYRGDWKEALQQLLQTNNFPEFTGRVCPAPCEGACVLGISEPPVTIKNIECAIIDHAFESGWITPDIPTYRNGKTVAVVGSGPAGLACAHQLNKAGYTVTVFERNDRPGGLLQYGIPTMKLSKEVVARRIKLMTAEGIAFKCNVDVGRDISASDLANEYNALVLCMGATWPRDLPLKGRQLNGIHYAMEFLETWQKKQMGSTQHHQQNNPELNAKDKDVLVIGGGDTGCDCIATSLRQGAKSITTFEILPEPKKSRGQDNPWPQWPRVFRVDYGHEEMKELPGTNKVYKADLVLLAMGFLGPERYVANQLDLPLDARSNVETEKSNIYKTPVSNVFAAGDCRRGQSLVVWAISEGRQAARAVDTYLSGKSTLPGPGGVIYDH